MYNNHELFSIKIFYVFNTSYLLMVMTLEINYDKSLISYRFKDRTNLIEVKKAFTFDVFYFHAVYHIHLLN